MSMPIIRLRQSAQFPANVYGDTGIAVTKANGNYTIEMDWSDFTTLSSAPTSPTNNVLTYDTATRQYVMVPSALLTGGGSGGIEDALSDGSSYGRLNATWAKVAPLASPALTGTPTTPTATPGTNTTQIATTAFVAAAVIGQGAPAANLVINGGFRINQAGYVSAATLGAGSYGHDQWKAGASGGDYSFTQLKSSTQITIASGKSLIQPIEDANVVGGSYVLSWTGTALARAGVNTLTPSGSYAISPLLISGQTAGTAMSIEFNAGTLGTVKLESGSTATSFIMRSYDQELQMCQRYLYRRDIVAGKYIATLQAYSTTSAVGFMFDFPVTMRAAPTATYSSISDLNILNVAGTPVALSAATVAATPDYATMAPCTGAGGLVAGNAAVLYAPTTTYFMFAARL